MMRETSFKNAARCRIRGASTSKNLVRWVPMCLLLALHSAWRRHLRAQTAAGHSRVLGYSFVEVNDCSDRGPGKCESVQCNAAQDSHLLGYFWAVGRAQAFAGF
jgi:hypothetical protein